MEKAFGRHNGSLGDRVVYIIGWAEWEFKDDTTTQVNCDAILALFIYLMS